MKNQIIKLTCIDMSVDGQGICKHEGLVIFAKGMILHETANVKIISHKKNLAYGIIDELLTEKKIPHIAVLASSWKSTLSIKGKTRPEQKRNAQAYVEKTYGVKATQDESDAICIGSHYTKKNAQADNIVDGGFSWSI